QPPQVTSEAPSEKTLEVDPQGRVVLNWSATDDYGLSQVALLFQLAGGKEERVVLQTPAQAARRLRGTKAWELRPLRVRAGDKLTYAVEARDNDAVDGPQRGASATQVLKVFSAAEHSREALLRAQALWERLVALAADRIEEKPAPATDASGWYSATGAKDQGALQLVSDLQAAGTALIKDKLAPREVGRALRYAASSLGPAVRRTLSEVERMRERIQELMARMQEMARGIRDEHLNAEAMENVERQQDLLSQLSDIQRKLQSGKVDDALKQLDQLGQDLEKLEKG